MKPDLFIEAKSIGHRKAEDGSLIVEGFASTGSIDEVGDIVEPKAFEDTLEQFFEFPNLFFQHDFRVPIGRVKSAEITGEGLIVSAEIVPTSIGTDVIKLVRAGALKAFSIGFVLEKAEFDEELRVNRIKSLRLVEVSIVSLPANREATFEIASQMKAWHRAKYPAPKVSATAEKGEGVGRPLEGGEALASAMVGAAGISAIYSAVGTALEVARGAISHDRKGV